MPNFDDYHVESEEEIQEKSEVEGKRGMCRTELCDYVLFKF